MRIYLSIPVGSYLYLLNLLEVSILDVVIGLAVGLLVCAGLSTCAGLSSTLIHLGAGSLHYLVEVVDGAVDSGYISGLVSVFELQQSLFDARFLVGRNLVTVVLEEVLGGEIIESAWFILSTFSRSALSAAAFCSASAFMRSISSWLRPDEASIRMACSLPVALSLALTLRIPLASISKVTSI